MDVRFFAATSNIIRVALKNSSTGAPLTGLTSASAGLIIGTIADNEATTTTYTQAASNIETITTLGTFAAPTASKCRFKEVDATNHPGLYEIQIADARFAISSARKLIISISGFATLLAADYEIMLAQYNPFDAVRLGLTALPNAAAQAAGGLYTRGTGAGQINQDANGRIDVNDVAFGGTAGTFAAGIPEVKVNNIAANAITATSIATDAITAAKIAADAIGASELAADAVAEIQSGLATSASISALNNLSSAQAQTAAAAAITAAALATAAQATAIQADTDDIQTRIPAALVSGRMDSSVGAMAANVVTASAIATDAIGAAEIAAAGANKIADHIIRRTQANARASSDGDAVSSRSLLGMLSLHRNKKDVSGSNLVVKTEDDSTTFFTDALSTDAAAVPIIGVDPA